MQSIPVFCGKNCGGNAWIMHGVGVEVSGE